MTEERRMPAGVLPTVAHAVLDYTIGVLLIALPWLAGFVDESTAATWVAVVAGAATLAISAVTDYEGGFLARVLPMRAHLAADAFLAAFLGLAPWALGWADAGIHAWLPFVSIAVVGLAAAAVSERERDQRPPRREACAV